MADTAKPIESRPSGLGQVLLSIVLVAMYWVAIVPLGLLLRLVGVDLMRRRIRRDCVTSYRIQWNNGRDTTKFGTRSECRR